MIQKRYTITRRILDNSPQTSLDLQLISNPFTENFQTPEILVNKYLNERLSSLDTLVPNLDMSQHVTGQNFSVYIPIFAVPPSLVNVTINTVSISLTIDNYGWTYAIAGKADEDKGKPKPEQIFWGFNSSNALVPNWYIEMTEKFTSFTLAIPKLEEDTDYNVYISGGSA